MPVLLLLTLSMRAFQQYNAHGQCMSMVHTSILVLSESARLDENQSLTFTASHRWLFCNNHDSCPAQIDRLSATCAFCAVDFSGRYGRALETSEFRFVLEAKPQIDGVQREIWKPKKEHCKTSSTFSGRPDDDYDSDYKWPEHSKLMGLGECPTNEDIRYCKTSDVQHKVEPTIFGQGWLDSEGGWIVGGLNDRRADFYFDGGYDSDGDPQPKSERRIMQDSDGDEMMDEDGEAMMYEWAEPITIPYTDTMSNNFKDALRMPEMDGEDGMKMDGGLVRECTETQNEWFQMDLGIDRWILGIVLHPGNQQYQEKDSNTPFYGKKPFEGQYVSRFEVSTSSDGENWECAEAAEGYGEDYTFYGIDPEERSFPGRKEDPLIGDTLESKFCYAVYARCAQHHWHPARDH